MSTGRQSNGVMLILGFYFGMGALIRSTVNSIWLARKFDKTPIIYWGKSCLYTDKAAAGNTYARLFRGATGDTQASFPDGITVYPPAWMPFDQVESVEAIDLKADELRLRHDMDLRDPGGIDAAGLCIVYQYLSSGSAMNLARRGGHSVSDRDFDRECSAIFAEYFQPQEEIQRLADNLWKDFFRSDDENVYGMHLRGSDKIHEAALPSPKRFVNAVRSVSCGDKKPALFVATDSALSLDTIKSRLSDYSLHYQKMERSSGVVPLHYRSEGALQNAISVIVDVLLLSRCAKVFAFPESQIYSWLRLKQEGDERSFNLIEIGPGFADWIKTAWRVLIASGWAGFFRFCRHQKPKLRAAIFGRLSS
jgi:hypothetical protein